MVRSLPPLLASAALLLATSQAHATYSLLIADQRTGVLGSVGTSCTGSYAVSRISGIAPGFGAIHAQAQSNAAGRDQGVRMLKEGASARDVIAAITAPAFDFLAATRQYGVVTLDGTSAGYTGSSNGAYAEDRQDEVGDYVTSYQGNILTSARVLDQLFASLEGAQGCDVPDALMRALEAGAEDGEGDSRCTRNGIPADAGFLRVVDRDGNELISIEVTSQGSKGAVVALRERFDAWREAHPCAVPSDASVAEASVADASVADASSPGGDASTPVVDASMPIARVDASAPDPARDASTRDAAAKDGGAKPDEEEAAEEKPKSDGCGLTHASHSGWWLLAALCFWRRRAQLKAS